MKKQLVRFMDIVRFPFVEDDRLERIPEIGVSAASLPFYYERQCAGYAWEASQVLRPSMMTRADAAVFGSGLTPPAVDVRDLLFFVALYHGLFSLRRTYRLVATKGPPMLTMAAIRELNERAATLEVGGLFKGERKSWQPPESDEYVHWADDIDYPDFASEFEGLLICLPRLPPIERAFKLFYAVLANQPFPVASTRTAWLVLQAQLVASGYAPIRLSDLTMKPLRDAISFTARTGQIGILWHLLIIALDVASWTEDKETLQ